MRITVTFRGLRSGKTRVVAFDLGSDYANNYAALKLAWDINAEIVTVAR